MNDIHALSGAYAVDALDDIERAQFARHLTQCSECRTEVDSSREAAGLLAETTAVEPPADLRNRVLAEIKTVRPLPPIAPDTSVATTVESAPVAVQVAGRPQRSWLRGLVAAAAVVAAVGAGGVVWHPWSDESSDLQLSAADQVIQAPDAERFPQTLENGAEATLVRSKSMNQAVLLTKNMPAPPAGKVYELWLQDADLGMVPAGLMPDGASTVLLSGAAADAIGAGITVEPQGGSHQPTTDPVVLFSFENA